MRSAAVILALALIPVIPTEVTAQSFGLGGRMSMVRGDAEIGSDSRQFFGGHIRARVSSRTAVEVALDLRTETNDANTRRVREYPIQGSFLLFPFTTAFAPYVLGGGGWYTTRVETLEGDEAADLWSLRDFGWHAGFGAELRLGRHAGVHADYRYTFLSFGDDETDETTAGRGTTSTVSRFLPSSHGSMWTAGVTVYF
jgi:hypothetical protein